MRRPVLIYYILIESPIEIFINMTLILNHIEGKHVLKFYFSEKEHDILISCSFFIQKSSYVMKAML